MLQARTVRGKVKSESKNGRLPQKALANNALRWQLRWPPWSCKCHWKEIARMLLPRCILASCGEQGESEGAFERALVHNAPAGN